MAEVTNMESNLNSEDHHMTTQIMDTHKSYGIPEDYNPHNYPAVKLREKRSTDTSETQRKRRSKNRLSNRRSTGFVPKEEVDAAFKLGPEGEVSEAH